MNTTTLITTLRDSAFVGSLSLLALANTASAENLFESGTGQGFIGTTPQGSVPQGNFFPLTSIAVDRYEGLEVAGADAGTFSGAAATGVNNLINLRFSQTSDFGFAGPVGATTNRGLIIRPQTAIPAGQTFSITFEPQGTAWGPLAAGPIDYNLGIGNPDTVTGPANATGSGRSSFGFRVPNGANFLSGATMEVNTFNDAPLALGLLPANGTTELASGLSQFQGDSQFASASSPAGNNNIVNLTPLASGNFGAAIRDEFDPSGSGVPNIAFSSGTVTFTAGPSGIPAGSEFRFSIDGAPVLATEPVPEPTSVLLVSLGTLALLRRRR